MPGGVADDKVRGPDLRRHPADLGHAPLRRPRRGDQDKQIFRLRALERPVHEGFDRHALRPEIRGLLDLERNLGGGHGARPAPREPDAPAADVGPGPRSGVGLPGERLAQRRRHLIGQHPLRKEPGPGAAVAEVARQRRQRGDRRDVADGVGRGPLLRHRVKDGVGLRASVGIPLARHERGRAPRGAGARERLHGVVLIPPVADPDHPVAGAQRRPIQREVERGIRVHRHVAPVRAQHVLADQRGVVGGAGPDQEHARGRRDARRKRLQRAVVELHHPGERIGLPLHRVVHEVGVARPRLGAHVSARITSRKYRCTRSSGASSG